jgi:hypothetical protein
MYANRYIIQLVMLQPDCNTSWERMTSNKIKNNEDEGIIH